MMYRYTLTILIFFSVACNSAKEKAKDAITKAGETVGQSTTEFAKGVSEGVDKSLGSEIQLAPTLIEKGIKTGKCIISGSPGSGDNVLSLYIIFVKDFKQEISVKINDSKGLEYGRLKQIISGKAGEARFIDFVFGERTNIESKSKFIIE
ncbi:MAG: hypothetical protein ABI921_07230 [Panacibacter sp.]